MIKFLAHVVLGIHIMEFLLIDIQDYSLKLKGRGWNSKLINLFLFLIVVKEIFKTLFAGYFFYFTIPTIIYTLKVKIAIFFSEAASIFINFFGNKDMILTILL